MRCDDYREAISARLDGEVLPPGFDDRAIDDHVAKCAACAAFAVGSTELHRGSRMRLAEPVPDLTAAILALVPDAQPRPVREWARYALLTIGLTQLVLALPALLLGDDPGASVHVAREIGSFDVALAAGLLWAAWQPRRATGLVPMAAVLAGAIALTAVVDLVEGDTAALTEAHHLLDLAGVASLYSLAHPPPTRTDPAAPAPVPA